jgi:hypothetical protein
LIRCAQLPSKQQEALRLLDNLAKSEGNRTHLAGSDAFTELNTEDNF